MSCTKEIAIPREGIPHHLRLTAESLRCKNCQPLCQPLCRAFWPRCPSRAFVKSNCPCEMPALDGQYGRSLRRKIQVPARHVAIRPSPLHAACKSQVTSPLDYWHEITGSSYECSKECIDTDYCFVVVLTQLLGPDEYGCGRSRNGG